MSDIFADDQSRNSSITVDDLVGDERKYKDVNQLASAYDNAERHLQELRRDNAQLRAKIDIANHNPNPDDNGQPAPKTPEPVNPDPTPKAEDEDSWRERIRREVKALDEEDRFLSNAQKVSERMLELFGDKAAEKVKQRARELGVPVEWLKETAARSPDAFFSTMNIGRNHSTNTPSPDNDARFRDPSGSRKNFAHFEEIRKTNPKLYHSPAVQQEMFQAAKSLGTEFYN